MKPYISGYGKTKFVKKPGEGFFSYKKC